MLRAVLSAIAMACAAVLPASAIPLLQLYIDGASYDVVTETWVTRESKFDLWVVGNVGCLAPGLGILEVQLAMAYYTGEEGEVSFTPREAWHMPGEPLLSHQGQDGEIPKLMSGAPLPSHGVYGPGRSFDQYALGDFTLRNAPVGDFQYYFPSTFHSTGQINVYSVEVTGYSAVHFDVFNHVEGQRRSQFGPFSHDGGGEIPEPTTLLLVGTGLAGCSLLGLRRRRR